MRMIQDEQGGDAFLFHVRSVFSRFECLLRCGLKGNQGDTQGDESS